MTGRAKILRREAFRTSRLSEFCSRKELVAQTGHDVDAWPLVVLKEATDNSLDGCEEAGIAPEIDIDVSTPTSTLTVADNGPGTPAETITGIVDYSARVSSLRPTAAPCAAPRAMD